MEELRACPATTPHASLALYDTVCLMVGWVPLPFVEAATRQSLDGQTDISWGHLHTCSVVITWTQSYGGKEQVCLVPSKGSRRGVETKTCPCSHENKQWVVNSNGVAPCTLSVGASALRPSTASIMHHSPANGFITDYPHALLDSLTTFFILHHHLSLHCHCHDLSLHCH